MSLKDAFDQDLLIQASAAAALAEILPNIAANSHMSQTQISVEQAIIRLLAPFQPTEAQEAQPTSERRKDDVAGTVNDSAEEDSATMPDPRLNPNWCKNCQKVHEPLSGEELERAMAMLVFVRKNHPQ